MIRSWAGGMMTPLEVMAERESVYQLLSQTTPMNISKNFGLYTIDPNSRCVPDAVQPSSSRCVPDAVQPSNSRCVHG